ncbi:DUF6090 family protein [Winogradskyella sp. R77965]|uniref:DUF6090 family protein n=1 Tax=Winogradskyella sp. R77965 TaxID=3093872 RepID=UPI0037DDD0AA
MENKTGKPALPAGRYFKYAIGEIILVVIGILIALQINNWNERRQKIALESSYLSEIKENLIKDTLNINSTVNFHKRKFDTIANVFGLFEVAKQGKPYFYKLRPKIEVLTDFKVFMPVRTGFDNMVSSEKIGLIRNKKIRTILSNYYSDFSYRDGTQERTKQLTREFTDDIIPQLMTKEFFQSFMGLDLDLKSNDDVKIYNNDTLISSLFVMMQNSDVLVKELITRKIAIKDIINQIDKELDND